MSAYGDDWTGLATTFIDAAGKISTAYINKEGVTQVSDTNLQIAKIGAANAYINKEGVTQVADTNLQIAKIGAANRPSATPGLDIGKYLPYAVGGVVGLVVLAMVLRRK